MADYAVRSVISRSLHIYFNGHTPPFIEAAAFVSQGYLERHLDPGQQKSSRGLSSLFWLRRFGVEINETLLNSV
jgi:hypothetical protein